jgi:hypothetical protein
VRTAKEIEFMTGITRTTHAATAPTALRSRRTYAATAAWPLLIVAVFVALRLAMQSGQHTPAAASLTQGLVQPDQGISQAPEPGYVRGRPY